jgi:two-component system, NtrC family, response regulator AtoC
MKFDLQQSPSVLLADSNVGRREAILRQLPSGIGQACPANAESVIKGVAELRPVAAVLGAFEGNTRRAIQVSATLRDFVPGTQVILIADESSEDIAIEALHSGVHRYFKIRASIEDIVTALSQFLPSCSVVNSFAGMVGSSEAMRKVQKIVGRVATTNGTVLISGETGTGKELVARAVHQLSARSTHQLVCVNCASIPDTLFESELFGYERGAFTGAAHHQNGLLRTASGGTLFLDEIGEMSARAQAKILRVIEDGEVRPLGSRNPIQLDLRVITATHRDLGALVQENTFRADLYFRLNVIPIHLPALRERREDIPQLVQHFIDEFNSHSHRKVEGVASEAMRLLCEQEWPGNIRQLRNAIEAAFMVCGRQITESDLKAFCWNLANTPAVEPTVRSPSFSHIATRPEPDELLEALQAARWNKTKAAELLHWSRMTVYRKIAHYRLCPDSKPSDSFAQAAAS